MKKLIVLLVVIATCTSAFAQFEKGKKYVSLGLTGLNLSYASSEKFSLGLQAKGGYFIDDSWMTTGYFDYTHANKNNSVGFGAGIRYYIIQNGLHIGANMGYERNFAGLHSFIIGPEIGYNFFVSRNLTIEPSVYYNISVNHFSDASKAGLRVSFGYIF